MNCTRHILIQFGSVLSLMGFLQLQSNAVFLCATAATAEARLSHRNSVCPSVTRVNQSKTVQARITKSSPSAA